MKRNAILCIVLGSTLSLVACLVAPDEPMASGASALICPEGLKQFNGTCQRSCTEDSQCSGSTNCMVVAEGEALCLDYKSCAFLGSDTSCESFDGAYGGYGSGAYGTQDEDVANGPYDGTPAGDSYDSPYGYGGGSGCIGNAKWEKAPAPRTGKLRCGQKHDVSRCQKVDGACRLVPGTIVDIAER